MGMCWMQLPVASTWRHPCHLEQQQLLCWALLAYLLQLLSTQNPALLSQLLLLLLPRLLLLPQRKLQRQRQCLVSLRQAQPPSQAHDP